MNIAGDVSSAVTGGMSRFGGRGPRPRSWQREFGMRFSMSWMTKRAVKRLTIIGTAKGYSRSLNLLIDRGARNGYPEVVADPLKRAVTNAPTVSPEPQFRSGQKRLSHKDPSFLRHGSLEEPGMIGLDLTRFSSEV
jgi:hypothetical protein